MYKLTFYDANCCPICDGTVSWFVEDLEEFEKNWLPLQVKHNISTVERYYRSKIGEIVTDHHSDSPELNIVQQAETEVLQEKIYESKDKEIELFNVYGCRSHVEFSNLTIKLRVIKYGEEIYLVGQYVGKGCKRSDPTWSRWQEKEVKYSQMGFYGNPVANYTCRDINWDDWGSPDAYKNFYTDDKEFFKHEKVETFVWLPIKKVNSNYKIKVLTKEELAILMRDIVGEAG